MTSAFDEQSERLALRGIAKGDPGATLVAVDDAFGAASASITDVHFFSGVLVTLHFEMAATDLPTLAAGLAGAGVELDDPSRKALVQAAAGGRVVGTLAITMAQGDPDQKHEIPAVPG